MALLKRSKHGFVQAGSLIESVMAITLITICLLIALQLHASILDKSAIMDDSRKLVVLNQLVTDMKMNQNYEDATFKIGTYQIKKNVSPFAGNSNLLKVDFTIQERTNKKKYSYLVLK
nr:hypothetical protein [Allomuricauda sp.]